MAEQEQKKITVYVKTPKNKEKKSFEVDENINILEFKLLIATKYNASPEEMALIFAGKIMKDNETLSHHHVKNGYTIHMVIRARMADTPESAVSSSQQARTSPLASLGNLVEDQDATVFPGFGNLEGLPNVTLGSDVNMQDLRAQVENEMLQNPDVLRQFVSSPLIQGIISNPENIRLFVSSNPQIRELIERNPEISHILNNPDLLRQTMELARNPAMFQELMRSHDRAISNLESIPGGYSALQRMYRDIQEPMLNAATEQNNPFAGLLDGNSQQNTANPQQGTENRDPLPNPWSQTAGTTPRSTTPSGDSVPTFARDNPLITSVMQQMAENPELVQNMMSSPHMQSLIQQVANDPNFVSAMQQHRGSENLRNLAAQILMGMNFSNLPSVQSLLSNPQAMLDIFNLTRGMRDLNVIGSTTTTESTTTTSTTTSTTAPTTTPSGDSNTIGNFSQLMSQLLASSNLSSSEEPPEQRYHAQLEQLEAMGFTNRQANIQALIDAFGDINGAVERLLSRRYS